MFLALSLGAACGDDPPPDDPQTPPISSAAAIDAWLAQAYYRNWACEPAAHAANPPSTHGYSRVCENALLFAAKLVPDPVGSAAVKELTDSGGAILGFAISLRTDEGDGGQKRFWYEVLNRSVNAIGPGTGGAPRDVCAACHAMAQRDFVFTRP